MYATLKEKETIAWRWGAPTPEDAEDEHGHQDGRGGRAAATPCHALHALCQQPQVQQAEAYARPEAVHPERRTHASGAYASGGKNSRLYTERRAVALQCRGQERHVAPQLCLSKSSPMRRLHRKREPTSLSCQLARPLRAAPLRVGSDALSDAW
jgi:hypothetical protein